MTFEEALDFTDEWLAGVRPADDPKVQEAVEHICRIGDRVAAQIALIEGQQLQRAFGGITPPKPSSTND